MNFTKTTILAAVVLGVLALVPAIRASSGERDVTVFSKNNTISINQEIDSQTVADWTIQVRKLDAIGPASAPIHLAMYTPGGEIESGVAFIESLKGTRRPIDTVTIFAASMGFQIVQNLGNRMILKNGILMSHHARGQVEGDFGGVRPSQLDSRYNFWLDRLQELDQTTVDRTKGKQTMDSYTKQYDHEMWLTGQKSVNSGYADKVVIASCDNTLNGVTTHNIMLGMTPVQYDLSDCPLIIGPINVRVAVDTNHGRMTEEEFMSKGGRFDAYCMQDASRLCALDTTLNPEKISKIKQEFSSHYTQEHNKVVYLTIPRN